MINIARIEALLTQMLERPNYVCWVAKERTDKEGNIVVKEDGTSEMQKLPMDPKTSRYASVAAPDTWTTFSEAIKAMTAHEWDGVGYVHDGKRFVSIDIDNAFAETGEMLPEVMDVVQSIGSYTEYSPSKTGIHIYVDIGDEPHDLTTKAKRPIKTVAGEKSGATIEFFVDKHYVTLTGDWIQGDLSECRTEYTELFQQYCDQICESEGLPTTTTRVLPIDEIDMKKRSAEIIELIRKSNGDHWGKFERLYYHGDTSDYPSDSEADLALCEILAFWTQKNPALIEYMILNSKLNRDKWERADYRERTIAKAISQCGRVYTPPIAGKKLKKLGAISYDTIEPKTKDYLFFPYIPLGEHTILAGEGGIGKSWLAQYITAMVSNGESFITDGGEVVREPRKVIYISMEDDPETVVKPHLEVLGADMANVFTLNRDSMRQFNRLDDERLEELVCSIRPALLVINPIQSFMRNADTHTAGGVRPILDDLIDKLRPYDCALLTVMHFRKGRSSINPTLWVQGTGDYTNHSRSVLLYGKDPNDEGKRVLVHGKNNFGKRGKSISISLSADETKFTINGLSDLKAEDVFIPDDLRQKSHVSKYELATSFLLGLTAHTGFIESRKAIALCNTAGYSQVTVYRALEKTRLNKITSGRGDESVSLWYDPRRVTQDELPTIAERIRRERRPSGDGDTG